MSETEIKAMIAALDKSVREFIGALKANADREHDAMNDRTENVERRVDEMEKDLLAQFVPMETHLRHKKELETDIRSLEERMTAAEKDILLIKAGAGHVAEGVKSIVVTEEKRYDRKLVIYGLLTSVILGAAALAWSIWGR